MAEKNTGKNENPAQAAPFKKADGETVALRELANDFLDLWQANLLAWGTDPAFFPALSSIPGLPQLSSPLTPPPERVKKPRRKKPAQKAGEA